MQNIFTKMHFKRKLVNATIDYELLVKYLHYIEEANVQDQKNGLEIRYPKRVINEVANSIVEAAANMNSMENLGTIAGVDSSAIRLKAREQAKKIWNKLGYRNQCSS
jgi:hypothetical protein